MAPILCEAARKQLIGHVTSLEPKDKKHLETSEFEFTRQIDGSVDGNTATAALHVLDLMTSLQV